MKQNFFSYSGFFLSLILTLTLVLIPALGFSFEFIKFENQQERQFFYAVAKNLRCMECANQSILDSNSFVAKDMRLALIKQIRQGKNSTQINAYFKAKFGDSVLYKPPFNIKTWILWAFAPSVFVVFLVIFFGRFWFFVHKK